MDIHQAIKERHSVRSYLDRPLDAGVIGELQSVIAECNSESGLNIQLVTEEPKAFSAGILKYGTFHGVRNYIVMAGKKGKEVEEKVGYYGEKIVLYAQTLGLNTCWVGLTYKIIPGTFEIGPDEGVYCVISIGYGSDQGKQHPLKPMEKFIECEGEIPQWFRQGVEAAILAPTAINQQKFVICLSGTNKVKVKTTFSIAGSKYLNVDKGIVKYHFEVGAGKENFEWEEE